MDIVLIVVGWLALGYLGHVMLKSHSMLMFGENIHPKTGRHIAMGPITIGMAITWIVILAARDD